MNKMLGQLNVGADGQPKDIEDFDDLDDADSDDEGTHSRDFNLAQVQQVSMHDFSYSPVRNFRLKTEKGLILHQTVEFVV